MNKKWDVEINIIHKQVANSKLYIYKIKELIEQKHKP